MLHRMKHMVMIMPIDSDIDEAQHVPEEYWYEFSKCMQISTVRDFEFEYHDGDDDSDDAITKCLEAVFVHRIYVTIILPILEIISCM